jgi:hypothetical protein
VFQTAYGDRTVPNPTAGTIYRAGQVADLVTYYRNDRTPTYATNPHGWLADPTLAGRTFGQVQLTSFLATGQVVNPNPAWFEVPVTEISDLSCLHYPQPQTGQKPAPALDRPGQGDCSHLALDDKGGWLAALPLVAAAETTRPAPVVSGRGSLPATGGPEWPLVPETAVLLLVGALATAKLRRRRHPAPAARRSAR